MRTHEGQRFGWECGNDELFEYKIWPMLTGVLRASLLFMLLGVEFVGETLSGISEGEVCYL